MKFVAWWGTASAIGLSIASSASAATTREVYNTAKSVTVKIESQNGSDNIQGSGILIRKQGNIFSLVTNKHVTKCLEHSCIYTITTPDGQRYPVRGKAIETSPDLDLAIVKFSSQKNYPIAKLGDSRSIKAGDLLYTTGFPTETKKFSFAAGDAIAIANKRLIGDRGGYTLVYNAYTNSGMSGSGVFDGQGRVIAIHGHGDRFTIGTMWLGGMSAADRASAAKANIRIGDKIGYNRGIPIQWLLSSTLGKDTNGSVNSSIRGNSKAAQTADEFLILGLNKYINPNQANIRNDKQQALTYFDKAIQLQPNYAQAYSFRSIVKWQLNDKQGAMADFRRV
jgi:hypothetical protein